MSTSDLPAEFADRRRLHRQVEYQHPADGVYSTADAMRAVRRLGKRKWEVGVRQPYNKDGEYDFSRGERHKRLRDAQTAVEASEAESPRQGQLRTHFNDRRGR